MTLRTRRQRCYVEPGQPYDEAGFGALEVPLELAPAHTAMITVDLWNMGWSEQPLALELGLDAEYSFLGVGRRTAAEAQRRTTENLAPALAAARAAGLTIIHSNHAAVVEKHPECLFRVDDPPPGSSPDWPPAEVGEQAMDDYLRLTFGEAGPAWWQRLLPLVDFPEPVRPVPGDFCVCQQAAVDHLLRELRITTIIYAGFLLSHCLLDNVGGLRSLGFLWRRPGYRVVVLRDCTIAQEYADTIDGFRATEVFITWLEASGMPTTTAGDFISACTAEEHP